MDSLDDIGWNIDDLTVLDEEKTPEPNILYRHVAAASAHQNQRLVLTTDDSPDALERVNGHGQWLSMEIDLTISLEQWC